MANGHGGARPGSGRPAKRTKHAGVITRAEKQIADRLPELIGKMLQLAEGGDREATKYLIDRILGKPTERQEQTADTALTVRVVYADNRPDTAEAASGAEPCAE